MLGNLGLYWEIWDCTGPEKLSRDSGRVGLIPPRAGVLALWTPSSSLPEAQGSACSGGALTGASPRSRTRELLASRRDFRMNACTPHATGTCLLELSGLPPAHLCPRDSRGAAGTGGIVVGTTVGLGGALGGSAVHGVSAEAARCLRCWQGLPRGPACWSGH